MAGTDCLVEKKVKFLGSWDSDDVTKDVMGKILQLIHSEKGSKVKLQLNRNSLRVMKNQISGMVLQNFIPLKYISFVTVNQHVPCILFVVSKAMHLYHIYTFKCENALDAGMFIHGLRDIRKTTCSVIKKEYDGINWTLRSKTDDDKRQQNKLEYINDGKAVVQINGGDVNHQPVSPEHIYQKHNEKITSQEQSHNKTMEKAAYQVSATKSALTNTKIRNVNTTTRTVWNGTTFSTCGSEVTQNALRSELESLPNEVRDIKLMLQKSTGINPDDTKKHNNEDAFNAVLVPNLEYVIDTNTKVTRRSRTESKTKPVRNGHTEDSLVRVYVPDYRYSLKHSATKRIDSIDSSGYGSCLSSTDDKLKASLRTYEDWRNSFEWLSGMNPSMRPRSAILSHNQNRPEILRAKRQAIGYKMVYDPRFAMTHPQPKSASLRHRTSTTVERPIESVYRRHGHHRVVPRHASGNDRRTIVSIAAEEGYCVEPNNNDLVIQMDMFEDPKAQKEVSRQTAVRNCRTKYKAYPQHSVQRHFCRTSSRFISFDNCE